MNDPSVFSRYDADRILRRAAEIEGSEDAKALSLDELRSIAGEAGFAPGTVERAIAEVRDADMAAVKRPPVQTSGLIFLHLSAVREIPVGLSGEQLMRVVRLFHPYREGSVKVEFEDQEMVWRDRKGLKFAIGSAGGVTALRVYVARPILRRGRWRGWVKAAADRLEMLTLMVARQDGARGSKALPPPPESSPR